MTREEFEQSAVNEGYGAPVDVSFAPASISEMHTHDKQSYVFVLEGEFILNTAEGASSYVSGQTCILQADVPHAEEAGAAGARLLVARK